MTCTQISKKEVISSLTIKNSLNLRVTNTHFLNGVKIGSPYIANKKASKSHPLHCTFNKPTIMFFNSQT